MELLKNMNMETIVYDLTFMGDTRGRSNMYSSHTRDSGDKVNRKNVRQEKENKKEGTEISREKWNQ